VPDPWFSSPFRIADMGTGHPDRRAAHDADSALDQWVPGADDSLRRGAGRVPVETHLPAAAAAARLARKPAIPPRDLPLPEPR